MRYRVQFRHPDSTPMERKWWYHEYECNCYMTMGENQVLAKNEGMFWFLLKCLFATKYFHSDPRDWYSEIREIL